MAEIVQGGIGPEASYDVAFTAGKLVVSVKYQGQAGGAAISANVDAAALLASLEAHVTNPLEKSALDIVQALIAKVP